MAAEVPTRQQDRDVTALGRPRWGKEEQDLILVGEESLDLRDDDAVMVRRLITLVAAPLTEARPSLAPSDRVLAEGDLVLQ